MLAKKYDPEETALVIAAQLWLRGFPMEEISGGLDQKRIEEIAKEIRQEQANDPSVLTPKLKIQQMLDTLNGDCKETE